MKQAARQTRGGIVAKCAALKLTPAVDRFGPVGSNGRYGVTLRCSIDCAIETSLQRLSDNRVVAKHTGKALAGVYSVVRLPKTTLVKGAYKFNVAFYAPVNRGATVVKSTRAFTVR
jgi:hypothetical protein